MIDKAIQDIYLHVLGNKRRKKKPAPVEVTDDGEFVYIARINSSGDRIKPITIFYKGT